MATFQGTQQLKFKRKVEAFFLSLRMNAQHLQGLAKMKNETRLKVLIYERETYGQNWTKLKLWTKSDKVR